MATDNERILKNKSVTKARRHVAETRAYTKSLSDNSGALSDKNIRKDGSAPIRRDTVFKDDTANVRRTMNANMRANAKSAPANALKKKTAQGEIRSDANVRAAGTKSHVYEPADKWLVILTLILFGLGCVIIFSASYPTAVAEGESPYFYIIKHLKTSGVGIIFMIIAAFVPLNWHKLSVVMFLPLSLLLLMVVLIPGVGVASGVANRWILIGGFTLQPSEFAKYALVLFMAFWYSKTAEKINDPLDFKKRFVYGVLVPGCVLAGICGLILLEKHLSCIVIIGLLGYILMLAGGADFIWTSLLAFVGGGSAGALYLMTNSYALKRITTHTAENADSASDAWQLTQGQYAIGSGGLFGLGLGNSRQKFSYVSMPQNDFVFTIWCEEMGFIGAVAVIVIFILLIWRGYYIALNSKDTFARLVAFGITTKIAIQFVGNIAVVTGLIPTTGISLPFFSSGGTAIVIQLAEMGVLFSVSRGATKRLG